MMKIFVLALTICFSLTFIAEAAFDLTVTPFEGGTSIRFGKVDQSSNLNREVKVRITTTENKRYQVRHRILSPLVNERGIRLSDEVLAVLAVRGSNAFGTLYLQEKTPLSFSDSLIYSSDTAGDSDSFMLVYSLDGNKLNDSGTYRGRISLSLMPQGGGTPRNVILNIELTAQISADVDISAVSGGKRVSLDTRAVSGQDNALLCSIAAPLYRKAVLYQRMETRLRNEQGKTAPQDLIRFRVAGYGQGTSDYSSFQVLPFQEIPVYTSVRGEADKFYIYFELDRNLLGQLQTGTYRGNLLYTLIAGTDSFTFPIDFQLQVNEIFDLQIISEGNLSFSNLDPNGPPLQKIITIRILSNLGRPYQVIQNIPRQPTNLKGDKIPTRLFSMKQDLKKEEQGRILFPEFSTVPEGETVIFNSNAQGDPAEFDLIYQAVPSYEIVQGNYSAKVIYSLSER